MEAYHSIQAWFPFIFGCLKSWYIQWKTMFTCWGPLFCNGFTLGLTTQATLVILKERMKEPEPCPKISTYLITCSWKLKPLPQCSLKSLTQDCRFPEKENIGQHWYLVYLIHKVICCVSLSNVTFRGIIGLCKILWRATFRGRIGFIKSLVASVRLWSSVCDRQSVTVSRKSQISRS